MVGAAQHRPGLLRAVLVARLAAQQPAKLDTALAALRAVRITQRPGLAEASLEAVWQRNVLARLCVEAADDGVAGDVVAGKQPGAEQRRRTLVGLAGELALVVDVD